MRKYLWLVAILSVAAAIGVYGTARYAARHPDSFLNNCTSATRLAMFVCSPLLPLAEVHETSGGVGTACRAAQCAHGGARADRLPNVPRLPKPTRPAKVSEPEEVIHIEQVDPMIAKAIAEALEVPQILEQVKASAPAVDQGPDEVVLTILDPEDLTPATNPQGQQTGAQLPPSSGSCRNALRMPYCYDSDGERQILEFQEWDELAPLRGTRNPGDRVVVVPTVNEVTGWLMPEAGDDTEEPSEEQNRGQNETGTGTVPKANPRPAMDSYHHESESCPYLNGMYCPRYTSPYYPPPVAQPETPSQETLPTPMEVQGEESEQQAPSIPNGN